VTREITLAAVLVVIQLLVLRVTQYAFPGLYFSSAMLFERRSEVTTGAILFRLAIPFGAGLVVPLISSQDERVVASAAGVIAWFLILWPIAWAPSVMLPTGSSRWIWALLLGFWVAFGLLPLAGVAVTDVVLDLTRNHHIDWTAASVEGIITSVPISGLMLAVGRIATKRVSFRDDPEPEEDNETEEWVEYDDYHEPHDRGRAIFAALVVVTLGSFGVLLARRRARR
jgi:hypothetical protein